MPISLTPALTTLKAGLGTSSPYSLNGTTLTGTNLVSLLQTYLNLSAPASLSIASTQGPTNANGTLVLSGTATILGITGAAVTVTFIDSAGGTDPTPGNSDVRAIDFLIAISPPTDSSWQFSNSFPSLAGTLFNQLALTSPTFLISSKAGLLATPTGFSQTIPTAFGLSFAGFTTLTGPLIRLGNLTNVGATAPQLLYGPIGLLAGSVPLMSLSLRSYAVTLSPFPETLALSAILQTIPGNTTGTVADSIGLSTPMSLNGIGTVALTGSVSASGAIVLGYGFDTPPQVTVNDLNPWGAVAPIVNSLPSALRGSTYTLTAAQISLADSPRKVTATNFTLATPSTWALGSGISLSGLIVQILANSPTILNVQITGYVPITDSQQPGKTAGVGITAISDSGFPGTINFSLTSTQSTGVVYPGLAALVNFTYPAWAGSLPAALSNLGTAIQITVFGVTVSNAGAAAMWSAVATSPSASWPLLSTPLPIPLALQNIQVQATMTAAGTSSATVSGTLAFGSPATTCSVSADVSGSSFASYAFALQPNQNLTLGALSASLCGSAAPDWIKSLPLNAGTLQITPNSVPALTGSFTVGTDSFSVKVLPGGHSPSTLTSFNGLAIAYANSAVTSTVNATWNIGPPPPISYQGSISYPYAAFAIGGGNTIPIPEEVKPVGPPDPDKAMEIAGYIIVSAGALVTALTVGAAILAATQCGRYAAIPAAANQVASTIWSRLGGALLGRAGLLLGGLLTVTLGIPLILVARIGRHGSNDQITPAMSVNSFKTAGVQARDAGDAVAQAYSLAPGQIAAALAQSYMAPETASALFGLYPATYSTATSMVNQLSDPTVFGNSLTPRQMTAALAAAGYPASEVGPAILQKYGSAVNTAALMAPILQGGWQDAGLTLLSLNMAQGLAGCAFSLVTAAPAMLPLYSGTALNDLATAMVTGYQAAAPASAMQLTIGLAAAGQTTAATQAAVQNVFSGLTAAQWTAIAAVVFAAGQAALLALVQTQKNAGATAAACALAVVTAQPQVALAALTANIYGVYSAPNLTAPALATSIKQGYGANPPTPSALNQAVTLALAPTAQTARQMIALLASSGYAVSVVAPATVQAFATTAGTAALLAPLLQGGYNDAGLALSAGDMSTGLLSCSFSLIQSVPAIVPLYATTDLPTLTIAIVTVWAAGTFPASALQMGQGLAAAGKAQLAVGPALRAAMPSLTAAQMLAVLSATYDTNQAAAALLAQQKKDAGQTATQAATAIVAAQPQIDTTVLAGVVYAVYSPANLTAMPLAQAIAGGLGSGVNPTALGQALPICYFPTATTASVVAQALVGAISGVTAVQVATALKAAGYARADALTALTAAGFSQAQATQAIIQVYGGTAVKLIGNASNVMIATALAPSTGTADFSLEIWLQATTGQGGVLICHQGDSTTRNAGFSLQATPGGSLAFTLRAAGGSAVSYQNDTPVTLFDGRPHYIAAVRQTVSNVTTMSLYLDGQVLSGSPSQPPLVDVTVTAPLYVGAPDVGQGLGISWVGTVWNMCLWTLALSAATIGQHANAGTVTAPQTGLAGFWPMTDGTVDDRSGSSNNGTLQGGAVIVQPGGV